MCSSDLMVASLLAGTDGPLNIVPIERAGLAVHFHDTERAAALACKCLPGTDIRMMVEFRDDNLIAGGESIDKREAMFLECEVLVPAATENDQTARRPSSARPISWSSVSS